MPYARVTCDPLFAIEFVDGFLKSSVSCRNSSPVIWIINFFFFITKGFNRLVLPTHLPHGAFYIFPDIRKTGLSSDEFCERLLNEQKVACVPGTAFGEAGEGFIRVSYAYSIEHIKEALTRIEAFLEQFDLD